MKTVGYIVVAAIAIGAGLYFGGYLDGKADVALTDQGRAAYNQGVESVQEGVGKLKVQASDKADAAIQKMDGLKASSPSK